MPQNHLARAFTFLRGATEFLIKGARELWKIALEHKIKSAILLAVIVALIIGASILFKKQATNDVADGRREVELVSVADISAAEPLSLIGEVRSKREASIASDVPGTVSGVYRSLGDTIGAGTVIAELKNDGQRAAVAQAKAALEKAKSGTNVGTISVENAKTAFAASQTSAASTIDSAYTSLADAVVRKADQVFSNPTSAQPKLNVAVANSQLAYDAESGRVAMGPVVARISGRVAPTTVTEELQELERLSTESASVSGFLSTLLNAFAGAIPANGVSDAAIAGYRADLNGTLTAVNATRSALAGTIQDLKVKQAAVTIALEGIAPGATGVSADIAAAEANLAAAQAQLEKTLIRAPISGTINRLDLNVGDFVNASVPVVFISNPSGLEAVAYVTGADLRDVVVGAKAIVGADVHGTITRSAQALDPVTKKAEVRVGIPDGAGLVSGQSVTVTIERAVRKDSGTLNVPLSALKITPEGPRVFTMKEDGTLEARAVTLGALRGSKVEIDSGLTADMRIVKDARGLKEGESVIVAE